MLGSSFQVADGSQLSPEKWYWTVNTRAPPFLSLVSKGCARKGRSNADCKQHWLIETLITRCQCTLFPEVQSGRDINNVIRDTVTLRFILTSRRVSRVWYTYRNTTVASASLSCSNDPGCVASAQCTDTRSETSSVPIIARADSTQACSRREQKQTKKETKYIVIKERCRG